MTSVSARRLAARKSRLSITAAVSARWFTFDPVRGRHAGSRVRLEQVCGLVAHDLEGVASFDQRQPLGQQPLQLDRSDFRAVLVLLAAPLCLLVRVELAFDPVGGAVEQVDGGPEQVFQVGLEAGVGKGGDEGVEDVCQRGSDGELVGQRPCVGFVLEGAMAVKLEFAEERGGRGFGVVRLVVGVGVVGHRGLPPAADRAHRGLRRRRRPGADRACTAARLRERPQRSGGRRGTAILFRDAKARSARRRKIGWPQPLPARTASGPIALSEGRGRGSPSRIRRALTEPSSDRSRRRHAQLGLTATSPAIIGTGPHPLGTSCTLSA